MSSNLILLNTSSDVLVTQKVFYDLFRRVITGDSQLYDSFISYVSSHTDHDTFIMNNELLELSCGISGLRIKVGILRSDADHHVYDLVLYFGIMIDDYYFVYPSAIVLLGCVTSDQLKRIILNGSTYNDEYIKLHRHKLVMSFTFQNSHIDFSPYRYNVVDDLYSDIMDVLCDVTNVTDYLEV